MTVILRPTTPEGCQVNEGTPKPIKVKVTGAQNGCGPLTEIVGEKTLIVVVAICGGIVAIEAGGVAVNV